MIPYIYLLGLSHSGSTLMAFLANAHPEIVSVGEMSRIGEILPDRWLRKGDQCSCGQPFYHCTFWNRALAGMAARGCGLSVTDPFDYPPLEREAAERRLFALVESMVDITGARVFFDASKTLSYGPVIAQNPHFEVRYIDLYRDGRGVISSWLSRIATGSFEDVVRRWINQEKQRKSVVRGIAPAPVLKVHYEDLARSPQATMKKIFHFAGVQPDVDVTSGYKSKIEHHIIGNQMRLTPQETISFSESWRSGWTSEMHKEFERLGGSGINRKNGYTD